MARTDELALLKSITIGREEYPRAECKSPPVTELPSANRVLGAIHAVDPVRAAIAGTYLNEMADTLREIYRVLAPGGYLVLVVANGTIAKRCFRTQHYLRQICLNVGFHEHLRLIDTIRSRGLMTKRNKTASVISRELVMLFGKD